MNAIRIWWMIFYDNLINNVVLIICCVLVSYNFYYVLNLTQENRDINRLMDNPMLERIICIQLDSYSEEQLSDFTETLDSLPYIDVIYNSDLKMAWDNSNEVSIILEQWGYGLKNNQEIRLTRGRMPSGINEILLCENLSDYYSLSQSIELEVETLNQFTQEVIANDIVSVTVVGFYSPEAVVPSNNLSIDSSYPNSSSLYSSNYNSGNAYAIDLKDNNGKKIDFLANESDVYYCNLVHINDSESSLEVVQHIKEDLKDYSYKYSISTSDEIQKNYRFGTMDVIRRDILEVISFLTVTGIAYFSFVFLGILKKSKEMTIYYMYGMMWKSILAINSFVLIPGIILGDIIGSVYCYIEKASVNSYVHFNCYYLLLSLLITIFTLCIVVIPLYVYFSKINPIETLARNEQ